MTRDELIAKLKIIAEIENSPRGGDTEGNHADADDLLLAFINDPEITALYNSFDKWYA